MTDNANSPDETTPARPELPTVADIMAHEVPAIDPHMGMDFAIRAMIDGKSTCLAVISRDGRLVGMLSRSQARPAMAEAAAMGAATPKVKDHMTSYVYKTSPDTPIDKAAHLMLEQGISTLPIVEEGKVVGVVTASDILREFVDLFGSIEAVPGMDSRRRNNKE